MGFLERWLLALMGLVMLSWLPRVVEIGPPSWILNFWCLLKMPLVKELYLLLLILVRNQNNLTIILVGLRLNILWNRDMKFFGLCAVVQRKRVVLSRYL